MRAGSFEAGAIGQAISVFASGAGCEKDRAYRLEGGAGEVVSGECLRVRIRTHTSLWTARRGLGKLQAQQGRITGGSVGTGCFQRLVQPSGTLIRTEDHSANVTGGRRCIQQ